MSRIFRLLLCLSCFTTLLFAANPPIKITIATLIGSAPVYLRVRVTVEPDDRNRWVCLYAQQVRGGQESVTSCWEVHGKVEAKTTWREIKRLGGGKWDITAAVIRNDERSILSNRYTVTVLGHGYYEPEVD